MASPKSGKAGSIVAPAAPAAPVAPLEEKPGAASIAQLKGQAPEGFAFKTIPAPPYKPPTSEQAAADEVKLSWIEIELLDINGAPISGAVYEIKMKDGSLCRGTLDEKGMARVDPVEEGTCDVTFPEYAPSSWKKK